VLTAFTAGQRFVIVWRQADRPVRPPRPQRDARREARRERRPFRSPGHEGSTPALRTWWETRRPRDRDRDRTKPRHLSSRRRTGP
jgi:hypothetical protein